MHLSLCCILACLFLKDWSKAMEINSGAPTDVNMGHVHSASFLARYRRVFSKVAHEPFSFLSAGVRFQSASIPCRREVPALPQAQHSDTEQWGHPGSVPHNCLLNFSIWVTSGGTTRQASLLGLVHASRSRWAGMFLSPDMLGHDGCIPSVTAVMFLCKQASQASSYDTLSLFFQTGLGMLYSAELPFLSYEFVCHVTDL